MRSTVYQSQTKEELESAKARLEEEYAQFQKRGLSLDMSRGKPSKEQTRLSQGVLTAVQDFDQLIANNTDYGNYGVFPGIPGARRLMGYLLSMPPDNIFVGGNSSLNLMHDVISFLYCFGAPQGKPWRLEEEVKFLCPVPGYDRHFFIGEHFGFTLIPVEMDAHGPLMDQVEELVKDPAVKGLWTVPKYSNPSGITYSEEVVTRLAEMKTAAPDFRILWDNAYSVHHLDWEEQDDLADIYAAAKKVGHEDRIITFGSTSKITFPGSGIAAIGTSGSNIQWIEKHMSKQTIGYNKINQLSHALFLPDEAAITKHMIAQAEHLKPKFDAVISGLAQDVENGLAFFQRPRGGYFISLEVLEGCGKRVVQLCKEGGVAMTPAGSTHPYMKDPKDNTIRIAPTWPPLEELEQAVTLLSLSIKLASIEKFLNA